MWGTTEKPFSEILIRGTLSGVKVIWVKINHLSHGGLNSCDYMQATVEWFKIYKMPDGKPPNEFAFEGKPKVSLFEQI